MKNISATNQHGVSLIQFENYDVHKSANRIANRHCNAATAIVKIKHQYNNPKRLFNARWIVQGRYTEQIVENLIRRYEQIGYQVEIQGYDGYCSYKTAIGWYE